MNIIMKPTVKQQSIVDMVIESAVSLVIGGPGVGKSFATALVVQWAESNNLHVTLASPTGKAAKRLASATKRYASTIHSMLGCSFDGDQFTFNHNKENPLNTDLIILDEVSMITNQLMARVIEAINTRRTRLLLIGDKNQLPAVGAGAVLRDILASRVIPFVELDEIFRNSGEIVKVCHSIQFAQPYEPFKKLDMEAESPVNIIHIETRTPEQTIAGIKKIVCERMPLRGYDPIEQVQVISPVNNKGPLSCEKINLILRDELNPSQVKGAVDTDTSWDNLDGFFDDDKPKKKKKEEPEPKFRDGDKVINTKNTNVKLSNGKPGAIVNGDIGIIKAITDKKMIVNFTDPDREVELPKSGKDLLHAYAITCHRFQGSEAPVIVIPISRQFGRFLSNAWIYTAISRGKDIVVTIGDFATIEKAIRNRIPNDRVTMLADRIKEVNQMMMDMEFEGI